MTPARGYFLDPEDASDMSRPIYVPIADSFFESSIMREDVEVRFVMLALIRLALRAGADGTVDMDPLMFAQSINLPLDKVEAAIRRLMEPDPLSSSPDENGRRIVPVNPDRPFRNWRLVNWQHYRHIVKKANDASRKRKERHDKQDNTDTSENVHKRPRASENVATKDEERKTKDEGRIERVRFAPPSLEEIREYASKMGFTFDAEAFRAYYEARGWKLNGKVMSSWKAACVTWQKREPAAPAPSKAAVERESADQRRKAEVLAELEQDREERRKAGLL